MCFQCNNRHIAYYNNDPHTYTYYVYKIKTELLDEQRTTITKNLSKKTEKEIFKRSKHKHKQTHCIRNTVPTQRGKMKKKRLNEQNKQIYITHIHME